MITYTMKASSGCGFVLNRKTATTDKTLVSNPVDGTLFIYDEKNRIRKDITGFMAIKDFFPEKKSEDYVIEPGQIVYAKKGIKKEKINRWFEILTSENEAIQFALRKNALQIHWMCDDCWSFRDNIRVFARVYKNCGPSVYLDYLKAIDEHDLAPRIFRTFAETVCAVYENYGTDITKYLIQQAKKSSMNFNFNIATGFIEKLKFYHLDGRRWIDYVLFDLWTQGCRNFYGNPEWLYRDYLDMQNMFYGKVKDKYPKDLETAHNILAAKVQEWKELKEDSPKFEEVMENAEDFCYSNSFDPFLIRMPEISKDLVEEGAELRHCVASYVEKVNNGDCLVAFMREKSAPDTPYLTVEILPNRTVSQVEGLNRRTILSEEEKKFLMKWAKKKNLNISEDVISSEEIEKERIA